MAKEPIWFGRDQPRQERKNVWWNKKGRPGRDKLRTRRKRKPTRSGVEQKGGRRRLNNSLQNKRGQQQRNRLLMAIRSAKYCATRRCRAPTNLRWPKC